MLGYLQKSYSQYQLGVKWLFASTNALDCQQSSQNKVNRNIYEITLSSLCLTRGEIAVIDVASLALEKIYYLSTSDL